MVAAEVSTYPTRVLREYITALEAAITVALADPKPKAVHRIRTSTRRIEALLTLLELIPGLPEPAKPARKSRKLLRKLRRAAGAVRDLDVQQDMLEARAEKEEFREDSGVLRRSLAHKRDRESDHLVLTLGKLQKRLALTLEALAEALGPAESLALSGRQVADLTHEWYGRSTSSDRDSFDLDPEHLHDIRKSAKLARYIVESASSSPGSAARPARSRHVAAADRAETGAIAAVFESLQEAGGAWHDLHVLARIAQHHLGKRSPLTQQLKSERDAALEVYQQQLRHVPA